MTPSPGSSTPGGTPPRPPGPRTLPGQEQPAASRAAGAVIGVVVVVLVTLAAVLVNPGRRDDGLGLEQLGRRWRERRHGR
jgi:hypothetical protein